MHFLVHFLILLIFLECSKKKTNFRKHSENRVNFYNFPENNFEKDYFSNSGLDKAMQLLTFGTFPVVRVRLPASPFGNDMLLRIPFWICNFMHSMTLNIILTMALAVNLYTVCFQMLVTFFHHTKNEVRRATP